MTKGVIARIYAMDFGDAMAYSITLRGDKTFYRLGNKKPAFNEGDSVQFDVEMKNGNSYARSLAAWTGGDAVQGAPAASLTGPRTADDFWRRKEQRDVDTQKRIELQSCRNSAIEVVRVLINCEAVKLPAKQADKVPVLEELVNHYTKYFIDQNAGKKNDTEAVNVAAVDAVSEDNKKNNDEHSDDPDSNWN